MKQAKTGNPLVDSVAEHQPGSSDAYLNYLGMVYYVAPWGVPAILLRPRKDLGLFLLSLAAVSLFFSLRMRRLVLLMALPASALNGCALGQLFDQFLARPVLLSLQEAEQEEGDGGSFALQVLRTWNRPWMRAVRVLCGLAMCHQLQKGIEEFAKFCDDKARWSLSHPQIVTKTRGGTLIDDYRESYLWLRENTAEDARIMAWWDYGYQIAGMANRTTIADGNTWNHEHIALLGLCLSSPLREAHAIARHLADYILVWAGGGGKDDVGKSKHMARIANSVYHGHCAEDDCDQYGVFPGGKPSKMMRDSLVYGLCGRTALDTNLFEEVYYSQNKRVRIVKVHQVSQESRAYAAEPSNRLCDAPGSWYCPGTYPPSLQALFNRSEASREAQAYQKAYDARIREQLKERPEPNGDGLPTGSYLGSCRGCRMEAKVLHCSHCRLPGSPSLSSSLDLDTCWVPKVNNIHGHLQCEPKPNGANIPAGGYQQSCKGCELNSRGFLACSHCSTASGKQNPSSYRLDNCPAPGTLDNDNGRLTCNGLPNDAALPSGPYLHSCQGCQLQQPHVVCKLCRRADGQQVESRYELDRCPPPSFKLDNQDGRLVCVGTSNAEKSADRILKLCYMLLPSPCLSLEI